MAVKNYVVVKFHELALKGKNRPMFMRRLVDNLRLAVVGTDVERVWQGHMFIGLTLPEKADWAQVRERVRDCLGVAKFYRAYRVDLSLESVKEFLVYALKDRAFKTFRITSHRTDKRFHLNSVTINRVLGTYVQDITGARVDLTHPDLVIFVDVMAKDILVYFNEVKGYGGLPVGVSGRVMTLLSGGIDSPVAAWQMMKRGALVDFVHFHSHPLVDTSSIEKAIELTQALTRFQYHTTLSLVPFGGVQQRILVSTPPSYRVVLYRRFMVRIAEELANQRNTKALVTGESLGQVASQTLTNIAVIDEAANIPIFRPLIGMNKEEIVTAARSLGTFNVSILPDQDCCTLFVPPHPVTHGNLKAIQRMESSFPVEKTVAEALENVVVREFSFPENTMY